MIEVVTLGAAAAGLAVYGTVEPNSRLFGNVIGRGPHDRGLYLTFDDGPNPRWTPRVLETLREHDVPAAFFMVGKYVAAEPALAREAIDAGHVVGNHTWSHRRLHLKSSRYIHLELERTHHCIARATRSTVHAFRAPHGYRNPFVGRQAAKFGYVTFGWTFGVWDTAMPGVQVIRERMRKKLRPGAVLLLHDGDGYDENGDRSQTVDALPYIIDDARRAGFEFRSLNYLLAA